MHGVDYGALCDLCQHSEWEHLNDFEGPMPCCHRDVKIIDGKKYSSEKCGCMAASKRDL